MTWHAVFDWSTIESRHLLFSYAVVFFLQGGYLAWVVREWTRGRSR